MLLNEVRGWAKGTLPTYQDRKVFFESIVNGEPDPIELLRQGDEQAVRDLIAAAQRVQPACLTSSHTSTRPGSARMVDVGDKAGDRPARRGARRRADGARDRRARWRAATRPRAT